MDTKCDVPINRVIEWFPGQEQKYTEKKRCQNISVVVAKFQKRNSPEFVDVHLCGSCARFMIKVGVLVAPGVGVMVATQLPERRVYGRAL